MGGTYNFQWRMVHENVRWFGAFSPNVSINVVPPPEQLHPPTNLGFEGHSRNLVWTPPDNLTTADQVRYDLWIYGPSCPSGCNFQPGAPSWYTIGSSIQPGNYTWTLQAISVSRAYAGPLSGPPFILAQLDLSINRPTFRVSDPDWTLTVQSSLISASVTHVEEFWNGSLWQEDWRGNIGQISASGVLTFVDAAPFFPGSFQSHVEAGGYSSNYVAYSVSP
jgi:hypothetical protein